jgi:peptidoglycan/xylan/chitin deacetylase (PgdA/CDA1 family)
MSSRLAILSYHNVEGTWAFPSAPGQGVRGFRAQLDLFARHANVVPLGEALRRLADGDPLPPRALAITFDDGYRDNLHLAASELRARGMPATFFLVPRLIDRAVRPWWEVLAWAVGCARRERAEWRGTTLRLDSAASRAAAAREVARELKRVDRAERERAVDDLVARLAPGAAPDFGELFVDAAEARRLAALGFEIGSHSAWHSILSRETPEVQREDLAGSRAELEALLDRPVRLLAYPNGTAAANGPETTDAARAAGYAHAVTTRNGLNTGATPPYELRRFVVYPERGTAAGVWARVAAERAVRVARRRAAAVRRRGRP